MYNNYGGYPYATYMPSGQNYIPQQPQTPTQTTTQQMSFVNGIEGAKGYIVPPNTSMFLMDSDAQQFFIKTADQNGMCNIKVYEFTEKVIDKPTAVDTSIFVTKEEFKSAIEALTTSLAAKEPVSDPLKKTLL